MLNAVPVACARTTTDPDVSLHMCHTVPGTLWRSAIGVARARGRSAWSATLQSTPTSPYTHMEQPDGTAAWPQLAQHAMQHFGPRLYSFCARCIARSRLARFAARAACGARCNRRAATPRDLLGDWRRRRLVERLLDATCRHVSSRERSTRGHGHSHHRAS